MFLRPILGVLGGGNGSESSEDESPCADDQGFIQNGERGVLVFNVYCVKTDRGKTFHVHLYDGTIVQYMEKSKKIFNCSNILSISIRNDHNVVIDIQKNHGIAKKQKRYIFDSDENASIFKRYIEYINEYGSVIRSAFDIMDRKKTQLITMTSLRSALGALDIHFNEGRMRDMLSIGNGDGNFMDYDSFFHIFFENPVSNIRECFLEWLQISQTNSSNSVELNGESGELDEDGNFYQLNKTSSHIETLSGEIISNVVEKIRWCIVSSRQNGTFRTVPGTLFITNYRIVISSSRKTQSSHDQTHSRFDFPSFFNSVSVPLCSIYHVGITQPKNILHIVGKDLRHVYISLNTMDKSDVKAETIQHLIHRMAFFQENTGDLARSHIFAFKYLKSYSSNGWLLQDLKKEYARQGLDDCAKWQVVDNSNYKLVDTYPPYFVVPAALTGPEIQAAAAYRSKGRLPAVTYRHARTGAVMTRSAQPLVGITMKGCKSDEKLLDLYRLQGIPFDPRELEMPSKFYILDARRQIAATLNMAAGKGTEDISSYFNTDLIFCDIDNIHVMRTSIQQYGDLLQPGGLASTDTSTIHANSSSAQRRQVDLSHGITLGVNSSHHDHSQGNMTTMTSLSSSGTSLSVDKTMSSSSSLAGNNSNSSNSNTRGISSSTVPSFLSSTSSSSGDSEPPNSSARVLSMAGSGFGGINFGGAVLSSVEMSGSGQGFFSKVEESGWLKHLRLILRAGVIAAEKLHLEGASILIHCSDGWDRTAQICGIAQVLLDPYFRTIEGFAVLIEKDWCAFGHKFQDRCGHGEDYIYYPDERSPVFLQFLDAVYQLLCQFPTAFEFSEFFLSFIADHLHSGLFGTFLGNSAKQREVDLSAPSITKSIWSHIMEYRSQFLNEQYAEFKRPIWPSCSIQKMVIWMRYFGRWDPDCHPNRLSGQEWQDDWGGGLESQSVCYESAYRLSGTSRFDVRFARNSGAEVPTMTSEKAFNSSFDPKGSPSNIGVNYVFMESNELPQQSLLGDEMGDETSYSGQNLGDPPLLMEPPIRKQDGKGINSGSNSNNNNSSSSSSNGGHSSPFERARSVFNQTPKKGDNMSATTTTAVAAFASSKVTPSKIGNYGAIKPQPTPSKK